MKKPVTRNFKPQNGLVIYGIAILFFLLFIHFTIVAQPIIQGNGTVCSGATESYQIASPNASSTYSWSVSPFGTITQNNGTDIQVLWSGTAASTNHLVSVIETDNNMITFNGDLPVVIANNYFACEDAVFS